MTKRYAIVGLGHRSQMYSTALLTRFKDDSALVGLCDTNQTRMDYYNGQFTSRFGASRVPTYKAADFDAMLREQRPDAVIVTSIDRTHHEYITRAMNAGCDVISEKPMTIDAEKCQLVLDTQKRTGRKLTVTFNYRYAPHSSRVKDLIMRGAIGEVLSVHFEWTLDTSHGADYFRRWHRDKANSGGLMVHKATHHFDLINWWLASSPETVFGFGRTAFYGRENAVRRGQTNTYARVHGSPEAAHDPWARHLENDPQLRSLYLEAEHEDRYYRDQGVFSEGITTEDDMAVAVRYRSGATMSYHLTAYSPWEGLRVMFNGTRGRLELEWVENPHLVPASGEGSEKALIQSLGIEGPRMATFPSEPQILLRPLWGKPFHVPVAYEAEGHGGGDARLLSDLFSAAPEPDPLGRAAGHVDGAMSILTGIAANKSFATGLAVRISELVSF